MNKILITILIGIWIAGAIALFPREVKDTLIVGAPVATNMKSLVPLEDNKYYIGTSTPSNLRYNAVFNDLVVSTCTGCSSMTFAFPFTKQAGGEQATSTILEFVGGFLSNASSTLADFTFTNATGTEATTTTSFSSAVLNITSTATSTFAGPIQLDHPYSLTAHAIRGDASDGTRFLANNWTEVANFGVGNTTNSIFYGAVNIDGATRLATSLTGILKASSGVISVATAGTDYLTSMTFAFPFTKLATNEMSTSTTFVLANGLISNASSTLSSLTATTTNLNVSANHISFGSNYVSATTTNRVRFASTTASDIAGKFLSSATTTYTYVGFPENRTLTNFRCQTLGSVVGGAIVMIGDGTNFIPFGFCDGNIRQIIPASNNTWVAGEPIVYKLQGASTTADILLITESWLKTSD